METPTNNKLEKLKSFSKDDFANSENQKLKEVSKFLNNESLLERINRYSETYWDQKWSQLWGFNKSTEDFLAGKQESKFDSENMLFEKHINTIFNEISNSGIIALESEYFHVAKRSCLSTCSHFFPLLEFLDNNDRTDSFLLATSYVASWTYFLDDALDYNMGSAQKIRANQVSSFLLLRLYDLLNVQYNKDARSLFNEHFLNYSQYLTIEKKWETPEVYLNKFGRRENIVFKASIFLLPIDLMILEGHIHLVAVKEIFKNFFSVLLLGDDLVDLEEDINSKCLTYPIIRYYELTGELPESSTDLHLLKPELLKVLNHFIEEIDKIKTKTGWELECIYKDIENVLLAAREKEKQI